MNYIVELEKGVWIAPWSGDPGRTVRRRRAATFASQSAAMDALTAARNYRQFANAKIQPAELVVTEPDELERDAERWRTLRRAWQAGYNIIPSNLGRMHPDYYLDEVIDKHVRNITDAQSAESTDSNLESVPIDPAIQRQVEEILVRRGILEG